jgi:tetraprenyl-beta-curcumene synthase
VCPQARSAPPTDRYADATISIADSASLSVRQVVQLASCATRELVWGLRLVARELGKWRLLARFIPDPTIRRDALNALACKRGNVDGAALFWIIPGLRNPLLLKLLVTYQVMWDFLDTISETGALAGQANGRQLHIALVDAIDPERPIADYYRLHPWSDDGSYLRSLVEACREYSARLPSFEAVRWLLVREADRASVQAINHEPNPIRRDSALRAWVDHQYPDRRDVCWFELSAAAGAGLSIYALFALAVEQHCCEAEILSVYNAYFPWASAVATMLDSYVDHIEDAANGDHVYIDHYHSPRIADSAIRRLVRRSLREAGALPRGERHTLLVACMVAMYLSKDSARGPGSMERTRGLVQAGGLLTKVLLPVLRVWRLAYAQRSN